MDYTHPEFPTDKYEIIYADPPWWYSSGHARSGSKTSVTDHYPTMKTKDICEMPIPDISAENSLLFMWATSPCLPDALEVGKAWGFAYSTVAFIWDKQTAVAGSYTMSTCEFVLVFKRGCIPQPRGKRNVRQLISCKVGRHSEKPHEVKFRIEQMFPEQIKIELFARRQGFKFLDDWDYWGLEV